MKPRPIDSWTEAEVRQCDDIYALNILGKQLYRAALRGEETALYEAVYNRVTELNDLWSKNIYVKSRRIGMVSMVMNAIFSHDRIIRSVWLVCFNRLHQNRAND